jgi:hypothetical protein
MQELPAPVTVTLRQRARFALAGLIMLGLWAVSLVPLWQDGGGFNVIVAAVTTLTLCPLGVVALLGGIQGSEAGVRRAQFALFTAGALLMLTVVVELLRRIVFSGSN